MQFILHRPYLYKWLRFWTTRIKCFHPRPALHLTYKPLDAAEIRLLWIHPSNTGNLLLQLEHFNKRTAPPFLALLYVWGNPTKTLLIDINREAFPVIENLHHALSHIHDLSSTFKQGLLRVQDDVELFFWIDAISIDQNNTDERSKQVPRMRDIYSSAYTVVVWFGTGERPATDTLGVSFLVRQLNIVSPPEEFVPPAMTFDDTPRGFERDEIATVLIETYFTIMANEWLSRIWVIQESSLSQRQPCAMLRHALFSFRALCAIGPLLKHLVELQTEASRGRGGWLNKSQARSNVAAIGPTFIRDWITSDEYRDKSSASQLLWLLADLGTKTSTVPHDQIYGLLGMLDLEQLPADLAPDYRQEYGEVCKRYIRFLIEQSLDLRIPMLCGSFFSLK